MFNEFPKQIETHLSESDSWKIFEYHAPRRWIIRAVTQKDYGIDAYVEIPMDNGNIVGDLCSFQLKSTKSTKSIKFNEMEATLKGIKKTTVNYWMGLPIPVFLLWIDIIDKKIYFCSVKEEIRKNYDKFLNKGTKSMGFSMNEVFDLTTDFGKDLFKYFYYKENHRPLYHAYISNIGVHYREYYEFILYNQGRDFFLPVEEKRQMMLGHLYKMLYFLARYYGLEWEVINLREAFEQDYNIFKEKDDGYNLHEATLTKILKQIEPIFMEILKRTKEIVSDYEKHYYKHSDYFLFNMYDQLDINNLDSDDMW